MVNSFAVSAAMGILLGFLSGLGVGGGSLLMLWLTLVAGIDHETARGINLMFFIPSALIASLFRYRQGSLELRAVLPAILAGIGSAVLASMVAGAIDTQLLKKPFGFLLLATGLRELCYRPRKAK